MLECKVIPYWLSAFTKWSLAMDRSWTSNCKLIFIACASKYLMKWFHCLSLMISAYPLQVNIRCDLRVTHICVSKLNIIVSDNGLLPGCCQAIIWTNAGIFLIGPLGTDLSDILVKIYIFSFKIMHLKMSPGNWWLNTGKSGSNFKKPISNFVLLSTLVQVIAWCHQAASYYLSQCWPRSMLPYSITRPQRVNISCQFQWLLLPRKLTHD